METQAKGEEKVQGLSDEVPTPKGAMADPLAHTRAKVVTITFLEKGSGAKVAYSVDTAAPFYEVVLSPLPKRLQFFFNHWLTAASMHNQPGATPSADAALEGEGINADKA